MHCWLIHFHLFPSERFCYICACWTWLSCHILLGISVVPNTCPARLPPPLSFMAEMPKKTDMVCRLVPLWHECVRHKNGNPEDKTSVNMLSAGKMWVFAPQQRGYSSNPTSSHSPRNGMDGQLCSDLPVLSSPCLAMFQSLVLLFLSVRNRTPFFVSVVGIYPGRLSQLFFFLYPPKLAFL